MIPFEPTATRWNLTMELEAPENANRKLQEVMDTKIAEMRPESQSPGLNPLGGLPARVRELMEESAYSHFWVARLEPVRPTLEPTCRAKCTDTRRRGRISAEESALEPLNKEDARKCLEDEEAAEET